MLTVYKASAGSGKTFALTLEYFKIIFSIPSEYKNILAVTFTNKATEEMKSRIINELHKLAEGEKSEYGKILQGEFGYSDEQLKNKAKLLRTMLLHDYGRIAVTTIDRFFQRVIKAFIKELNIFPGYNVELDSEFILLKAVDQLMAQVKNDPDLRNWINELMNTSVDEGKSWSVKTKIAELGEELFKENYMLFDKNILDKFSDKDFLRTYRNFLGKIIADYEKNITFPAEEAIGLIEESGLRLPDFKGNKSSPVAYFYKLYQQDFSEPTATVRKAIDTPEGWYTKTSENRARIETLFPDLNRLLKKTVELFDNQSKYYNSAKQLSGNLYQLGILNDLYRKIREYCNEKGLMMLSDTTHILNILIDGNDTPFLFEKMGNTYKHLMIDEFQDTSAMQWKNFKPLVSNSLSDGNKAIIVGDVKQSIYRWRNGDWRLLAYGVEKDLQQFGIQNKILGDNWRSAREIVEFNNLFFEKAALVLAALYDTDTGESNTLSQTIMEAYAGLKQKPQKNKTGYVDIKFGPEKKEEDSDSGIMDETVSIIRDILERGGQLKDIVILVRGSKEGAFVSNYLMEYNKKAETPVHFISNDSLYVWVSPYVKFIVAILKYTIEPYDQINKATILYFYDSFIKSGNSDNSDDLFKKVHESDIFRLMESDYIADPNKIMAYSLYEIVEDIIDKFSLKEKTEEVPYLIALQDIIFEYETKYSNSITLFLEWWEKERSKRVLSTSEEVNAIKILTIHKSKGLEFEYVILPFCTWELDSVRPVRRIWCDNAVEGFRELDYAPLDYSSKLAQTIFQKNYYEEHLKSYVDNLNLLYVALTRAKSELYIRPYAPRINKDGSIPQTDVGAFIFSVLSALKGCSELQIGDNNNLQSGEKKKPERLQEKDDRIVDLQYYPVYSLDNRVSIKYRNLDYNDPVNPGYSAIDEGKLLHEIFKSIVHSEDIERAVVQAYLEGLINGNERDEYVAKISGFINGNRDGGWFDTQNKIINERDILFPSGERIRPDRIVIKDNRILVIDYKFGQNEERKYLKQVRFYCDTLKKMGYEKVEGYVWYVKLGKIKSVL